MDAIYHFGRFELRPAQRQLLADGRVVALGARAFDVLLALIERTDRVVGRNELLDIVWPGVAVEENNLTVQVGTLRKLVGNDVIATIPGRGYRFTALSAPAIVAPADAEASAESAADVPALAPPNLRTNLPAVLQPLIGRDDDLAALGTLLARHRLITITGAGGMGKTRLGQRLLHDRQNAFPYGVAWVELAAITEPALVPGAIAAALGLETGAGDPLKQLVAALSPLQMLVALDNAEHLGAEGARVVQALLQGAPTVQVLVTSQAPLQLAEERVYRLGALAVPDDETPLDEALAHGAVALFVDRAHAADRRFVADAQTLPAIISICAQLDGMALALELAAARVPLLGVTALAALLHERLRLLTGGRRDAPQRQRTLRAALEWSHGLLEPFDAVVFGRLGVFVGSFSLEAARVVAADSAHDDDDDWRVVDAIGTLVDRSLVSAEAGETPRYRLLESAREFARERLAASGEEEAVRQRHAVAMQARFAEVAMDAWEGVRQFDQSRALLEPDVENGRAALAWFLTRGDALAAVGMTPSLYFSLTINRRAERARLWEATTPLISDSLPPGIRASWAAMCSSHFIQSRPHLSLHWARTALNIYRELDDAKGIYLALGQLGLAAAKGDGSLAECEEACAALRSFDERRFAVRYRITAWGAQLGLANRRGDVVEARAILHRLSALAQVAGDEYRILAGLSDLIDNDLAARNIEDAVQRGIELEQRLRAGRHLWNLTVVRINLTAALVLQGAIEAAHHMARVVWPMAVQFDVAAALADHLALLAALTERPAATARLLGYADRGYTSMSRARDLNELRAAQRAASLARASLGEAEFERLRAQPTTLTDDEVLPLALAAGDSADAAP